MNGGKNANFGKPLPKEQFRRSGIFFGSIGGTDMQMYNFSYKNQGGIDFKPNTFEWVHFLCIEGSNGTDIYGATDLTINRIIYITDLNAELDYDNDGITTCWIPEHLTLDFGIGSSVIIVGRTSQRTVDGEVEPVTINTSGLLCTVRHGSSVEVSQPVEDNTDWF